MLFDFSLASDESAGPRTVMSGLLRGWSEAHPEDRLGVFGPAALRTRAGDSDFDLVEARINLPPRRVLQQQVELPVRRLARGADVVIAPNLTCSIVGLGAPIVGIIHDIRHLRRPEEFSRASRIFRGAVWTASARRMAAVASVSEFSLREADDLGFPLPPERMVIPHGLDHVRRDSEMGAKRNTVVCVGHRSSKGLNTVPALWATVQAALGADRPDLVITGVAREEQPKLARAMAAAGVVDGFRIEAFMPEVSLYRAIAEAKAVLYLSAYEGYGLVPSEASVLGTHSFVYDLAPYRERATQLSITAVPVGDTAAVARELTNYLRAGSFDVGITPMRGWADAAREYHALAERVTHRVGRRTT